MQCIFCKQESEHGTTTQIVTGIPSGFAGQTTTYSNFQPTSLWFCETCWRVQSAKKEGNIFNNGLTMLAVAGMGLVGSLIPVDNGRQQVICGGIAGLVLLAGIFTTVYGARKRANPTDWSSRQLSNEKPKDAYELFKDIIPALVYELKGSGTYYWTLSNWQAWMKHTPNVKVYTNGVRYPKETATEAGMNEGQAKIQQKIVDGDLAVALKLCEKYGDKFADSAFFFNQEGVVLEKMGRRAEAIVLYRRAILFNPGLAEALANFARLSG